MIKTRHVFLLLTLLSGQGVCLADVLSIPDIEVKVPDEPTFAHQGASLGIEREDIEQQGALSVTDFLQSQGLVNVKNSASQQNQSGVSMRGFGSNAASNSLILLDGLPLLSFSHVGPNLNSVMIESIHSLDILPGSYGSLYGSQAVGGVINLHSQIGPELSKASLSLGNLGQRLGEFYWSRHPHEAFAYSLGGMSYQSTHYQAHNRQNNFNFNALFNYRGANNESMLRVMTYRTDIELPTALVWRQEPTTGFNLNHSQLDGQSVYLTNSLLLDEHWQLQSGLALQKSQSRGVVNIPFVSHQQSLVLDNRLHYDDRLITGFEWVAQAYDLNNAMQDNRVKANQGSVFASLNYPINQTLSVTGGLRYAGQFISAWPTAMPHVKSQSRVLVNEQGLLWQVSPRLKWYVRRDTNYRFAKANETIWVASNTRDLQTQTGSSYETGITQESDSHTLSLNLYRLDLINEIAFDPMVRAESPFGQMVNLSPTRRIGLDGVFKAPISQQLALDVQTSLVDASFSSGPYQGRAIPTVSRLTASLGLNYQFQRHGSVNFNEKYSSPAHASYDLANQGPKLPGIFLTNLYWQKRFDALNLGVQVNNVFDKHFARFARYVAASQPVIYYYPDDGLSVLVKASVEIT